MAGWGRWIGLWACTWLGWLAFAACGLDGLDFGFFLWCAYVPLPYAAAWLLVMTPSARAALRAVAFLALCNVMLTGLGLLIGVFSLGLLAFPAIVLCATLFGHLLARAHLRCDARVTKKSWARTHWMSCLVAGCALVLLIVVIFVRRHDAPFTAAEQLYVYGGAMTAAFLGHMIATILKVRAEGLRLPPACPRILALLLVFLAVPLAPIWPASWRSLLQALHAPGF